METWLISGLLCLCGLTLAGLAAAVIIVLLKLGVIASYAVKEEPPDEGVYDLDQSREIGE